MKTKFAQFAIPAIASLFAIAILAACSSSKLTSSWTAANASVLATSNKILVLGIIQDKDIRLRMQMEGWLVDGLKAKGYNAVSAYTLYGPKMFDNKSEESVLAQLRNSNIDEVFTIALLDKSRQRQYQPGTIYPSPFWGYYSYMYGQVYSPGYTTVTTRFFWEGNLYDVRTKALLYSAQSETYNPSSASNMARDNSKTIVKNMIKKGLIAK
jgi:hypothetical protein